MDQAGRIVHGVFELTPAQIKVLEKVFAAGFRPIAIPPYENALCVRRGDCAAVLAPVKKGGLKLLAPATYLVEGKLSVRVKRGQQDIFVWKEKEVEATEQRVRAVEAFRKDLMTILELDPPT